MADNKELTPVNPEAPKAPQADPLALLHSVELAPVQPQPHRKRPSLEDEVENPKRIIRQGMLIVVLFFGVMGAWSVFGTISGAVVAPGTIKVESERKTVQHLEGGIIDSILVREGDHVDAGAVLLTLRSIQVDATVDMLYKQLVGHMAAQARLQTEKNQGEELLYSDELKKLADANNASDMLESEHRNFTARRDALRGQISLLTSQIAQVDAQISGTDQQIRAENAIIGTLREELSAKRELYNERYLEKSQILELERQLATHQGRSGQLVQGKAEAQQRKTELKLRIDDTTNRFVEEATAQFSRTENEVAQTREKIRPMFDAKDRLQVVAPVTGKVVGLRMHSVGGVIRAGEAILDIVPDSTPMIITAQVPVNRIADVHIGQEALVQMDAFDTRITPNIAGKVIYLSADRLEDQKQPNVPYYEAHIELSPESLSQYNLYMLPGMPATVFITTKKRSVLYFLTEPLVKNWARALRD